MSLFLERIPPSMEAGQLRFLLAFRWPHLPSPFLQSAAFAGKAAKGSTHSPPSPPGVLPSGD